MKIIKGEAAHSYLRHQDISLREAMKALSDLPYQFFLVGAESGAVLGSVTDGDIRRGLLRGLGLEDPVSKVMNTAFHAVRQGETDNLRPLISTYRFVPVLDVAGRLVAIYISSAPVTSLRSALIMAGGFGRRLGKHTRSKPKPLVEVGDRPLLGHVLQWLDNAKLERIYVSTFYLGEQIERYLIETSLLVTPTVIRETRPLGTAGSLSLLPADAPWPVLVVNGDVLTRLDLSALDDYCQANDFDGVMAVSRYQVNVPFGVVTQTEGGLFFGMDEKPNLNFLVAAGIYLLGPRFKPFIIPDEPLDMPELLERARLGGLRIGLFPVHEYWRDVGRPEDLVAASRDMVVPL